MFLELNFGGHGPRIEKLIRKGTKGKRGPSKRRKWQKKNIVILIWVSSNTKSEYIYRFTTMSQHSSPFSKAAINLPQERDFRNH